MNLTPFVLSDVQGMPGEKGEKGETGLPGPQVLFLFFESIALSSRALPGEKKTIASKVSCDLGNE